jgi:hypothetical protein
VEGGIYMSSNLFDKNRHLLDTTITKIKNGLLQDNDLILTSEHICNCEKCADDLANSFSFDDLAEAPLGFEEEIKNKIKGKKENNIQFMFYSFRVAIAACIALVLVFSNALNFLGSENLNNINSKNLSIVSSINSDLNNFSKKVTGSYSRR